jgi:hypothetical protein
MMFAAKLKLPESISIEAKRSGLYFIAGMPDRLTVAESRPCLNNSAWRKSPMSGSGHRSAAAYRVASEDGLASVSSFLRSRAS